MRRLLPALLLAACGAPPAALPPPPSVLVAVFDTTRFDDWSAFGAEHAVTPNLDGLAARSVRFTHARTLYPATVPSHVSLFTGNAVLERTPGPGGPRPDPRFGYVRASLFTILREHGWRTYSVSGNKNLHPRTVEALRATDVAVNPADHPAERIDALFDHYGERAPGTGGSARARRTWLRNRRVMQGSAESVNRKALAVLREHAARHEGEPFLLFVNYNDAHDPYFPEPPWDERFASPGASRFNGNLRNPARRRERLDLGGLELSLTARGLSQADLLRARDLHQAELAYADDRFGRLLAALDELSLLDGTAIVALSDHGELFGEYGRMSHGGAPVEELVHVPLLLHLPGGAIPPRVVEEPVDLRDVKPTLLDFAGIHDDSSTGRSLLPLLRGEVAALPAPAPVPRGGPPGGNLIGGQGDETTKRLQRELRALGYVE